MRFPFDSKDPTSVTKMVSGLQIPKAYQGGTDDDNGDKWMENSSGSSHLGKWIERLQ